MRGGDTDLLLRVLYFKCLADMLSDSGVRGDDCIDGCYLLVISGIRQKSTKNYNIRFVLDEN